MPLDDKTFDAILSGKPATAPASDMAGGAITDIIRGAAAKYDIDPDIMVSLANRESGLRPDAKNPQSSAGGLFQFIDGTWKQYGRGDKFDPVANADAAARMLRENLDRFGGNYDAALAAHHVGPGKALQALRDGSIGDVNVSTQKWLADIKGQRQLNDELKAQKRNAFLAEDNPEYRPDFGGDIRPNAGSRSGFQAIGDTGASVLKGIGHFGESMGGLYGLATGDVDQNVVQTGGKALADFAESLKSDFIKNKERLSQQDIDAAEGHFNKFATAAWSNMSDPALFVNFLAEQAINFVPGMAAGRMAKGIIAGLGGASAAAIEAAPLAQKAMLMKRLETAGQIGTGVSVATGAVLQGADAGNSAYQQVMGRPQTEWDANPDYQRLVTTHGMDGAKQQIALQEARAAFAKSAVLSAGLNSFAPAHSIDKILVNGLKNKALTTAGREVVEKAAGQTLTRAAGTGAVKGFLGESASEALDEGYSQYAANEAEAAVNPNKDLLDDVAQNAGLGAAFGPMGAVTGGIEGHTRRKSAQELLQIATQQAAAQPNSPLSRAAAAAGPAVQASEQVAAEQVAAADPLAEQVAAIGDRLNDRAIYDAIRSHENLGPQALSDILGAYRVASNFNLDIKQRQAAVERLNNFFQLFDNQPNFTMGANGEAEQGGPLVPAGRGGENRRQESNVPTYDVGAPALGYQRRGDTLTDERAKQAAAAEYEQAYQDLVKAEQLGAGDQELMQRQMALRQAEARLQEIQRTIDGNRQMDSAAKRDALLGDVLAALPPGQNPNRAFDRALRNAGFNETQFSEAERAKIAQWQQLSDGFMQQDAEPSRPNEMDAAALGIKEKQAAQAPANPNLAKVDAMLNAGMQRKGDKMFDPRTGKSVKLSPAQIARAKHVERQNDRNRVMPAYQRAIEQRTRELEQLLSDPNHDEAAAVRLARGLSGLKQMVEQLQRGASLDEAIGNVFGQVGSQFANQLKNPNQRKDDAGDAPAAVESAPQPKAPRGGSRLTPLQDERLAQYGDDLQAMAGDAGWAEEGGKLIRNDDGTMSRTRWIPRAEWFVAGMLNNPQASEEAVRKALAGEPMYRAEKLHVMGMMDFLDAQGLSDAGNDVLDSTDAAISEDSDFGLPDYSAETAAVIELEFAQGSVDVPAFLEAIGANDEENDVTKNETGAGQAGSASGEGAQAGREDGQDAPGAGRAGSQSQGFGLTGQTNEQAAAEYAQQQAEQPADITKAQADKERDAVPFSLSQQSQPKPQGVQGGLFTADGRASVDAKQEEQKPFDEAARNDEREKFKEQLLADVRAGKVALVEGQQKLADFDKQTKAMREGTAKPEAPKNRRDGFEQHLAEIRQRKEDRLKQAGDVSQGAILANEGGTQWQMVLPDVEGGGKWRTQSFDDRGFSGHMVFNSMQEALEDAVGQGYFKRDDEALDRLQGTPKFQRGNFAADLIRRINTGEIDMKEGDRLLAEYDAKQNGAAAVDENSDERLVERAEVVAKKYDDAGYPDHGKIIRASLKSRQPSRDNVEFWESSFDRNLAQWKAIEKANAGASAKPVEPKLRTADDLIETRNEERAYDVVPAAVIDAVLGKLNGYIKELAAKGLHLDEVDSRFPNDLQVIKRNESGLRGLFNRYAKQLNAIARGYKRANEDGFAETEQDLSDWIGVDVKKLRPGIGQTAFLEQYNSYVAIADRDGIDAAEKQAKADQAAGVGVAQPGNLTVTAPAYWLSMNGDALGKAPSKVSDDLSRETAANWRKIDHENIHGWMLFDHDPWLDNGKSRKVLIKAPHMIQFHFEHGDDAGKAAADAAARQWAKANPAGKYAAAKKNQPESPAENADTQKPLPNATAPEHVQTGVTDEELDEIVAEFNEAQERSIEGGDLVSHVFDAPKKNEIVRLDKLATVYHKEHGWMSPAEAKEKIAEWKRHAKAQGDNPQTRDENSRKVVLSLFDRTGSWSQPWEDAGYQVWRFDIQNDAELGDVNNFSTEFFNDWFGDFDGQDIYAILAACPCTDFASSGARHFAAKDEDGRTIASVKLVHKTLATIEYFKPAVWAVENPVGRIEKLGGLPPWRMSFNPSNLGDPYTKMTLLWGRFNGNLPIAPVEPTEGSKMWSKYGGSSLSTKNARSETPEGFAYSFFMANNAIDHPAMAIAGKYDRLDADLIKQAVDAGVETDEIDSAVEDYYYQDLDDDAANDAIRDLIAERAADEQESDNDGKKLGDVMDYERFVLISADDISKLRKIDVERVLEQGAVKQFRQEFADWIKAKRPDLAKEVDEVMADIAPAMTYDQFKSEMQRLFSLANKYKPGEIGFNEYSAKMADLSDAHPELSAKFDKEFDGPETAALPAKTGLDKAADAIDAKIDDVAARLAAKFKASRGTLNSGVDPELLMLGAELGSLYIAKGVVKFAQYARAVLDKMKEFGIDAEEVKPMLKKFYLASQDGVDDATFDQMDDPRTVRNFDLDSLDADDSIQDKIAAAEQATNHDATPAQKEAGNYAKGKFPWNGLTISVETAKGEDRTDKETNGEKWRVTMPATYGYILRTTGADGDHVDAFMGPNPESDKVFVINQTQAGSEKFDEHKVMLGYPSERAAKADYLASFSDGFGRKVFGSIEGPFSVDEFRRMLDDGEFERKEEVDFGRRLNERTPLSDITVTVDAVEAETGRTVEMDENAADALKDVDDRMKLARSLLECLAS